MPKKKQSLKPAAKAKAPKQQAVPKKRFFAKRPKASKTATVEVKPTKINGIEDPGAVAAMAPETIKVPAAKSVQGAKAKKKPAKTVHPKAKMTFRHNVLPPVIGILAFVGVLGLLNAQWISAQYQYYFTRPADTTNLSTAANNTDPNAPAKIYIPKISVDAPVVTTEKSYNQVNVQLALRSGVLQYGASADPGQRGNVVMVGHSSGQLWAPGNYKFVFTLLDKLAKDDRILVDFKGKRYIYRVSSKTVVDPTDISVLQPSDGPQLTLITCTPVGTSKNRLVVVARQISPNPSTATEISPGVLRPVTSSVIPN